MIFPILAAKVLKIKRQPDISFVYFQDKELIQKVPINESAVSILELCNGINSDIEIIDILSKKYSENVEKVRKLVSDFIDYSLKLGFIIFEKKRRVEEIPMLVLGGKDQWIPDSVIMELTYDCPLNCRHCYLDSRKPSYMNFNRLLKICKELVDIGTDTIQLTGGEPLIYPRINEIIDYLSNNNITIAMTTSGFISKNKLEDLHPYLKKIANTNGIIQLSLDGFKIHHNNLRGNPKSFKRAISFMDKVIEQKVQLQVATIVTEDSIDEIENFSKFLKSKGVKVHRIGFIFERGRAKKNYYSTEIDYIKLLKHKINELKKSLEDTNYKIMELDEAKEHQNYLFYKNCGAGSRFYRISPDFKLYPCILIDIPIGDLNVESMYGLFQDSPRKYTKIPGPSKKICGDCNYLLRCEGCFAEGFVNKDKVKKCLWYDNPMVYNIKM